MIIIVIGKYLSGAKIMQIESKNASLLGFFACSAPKHIKRYVKSQTITNKIEKKTKFCLLL